MHQPLPSLLHATQQGARCMVKPPEKEKEKEKNGCAEERSVKLFLWIMHSASLNYSKGMFFLVSELAVYR